MLWHKVQGAGGLQVQPVAFVGENSFTSITDTTRTLTLSGLNPGDMVVAVTGNRISSVPPLPSGWSNITGDTTSVSGADRSLRVQYRFATSTSQSITALCSNIAMIGLRNASTIGQYNTYSDGNIVTSLRIPSLAGLDTSGVGFLYAGSYVTTYYTSVTSPWSLLSNAGVYVSDNTSSSIFNDFVDFSTNVASLSFALEILP